MNPSEKSFVKNKAKHCAENIIKNSWRLTKDKSINSLPKETGKRIIIIGAGWSLPDDLSEYKNDICIATNSSIKAALERGIIPKYVISRESIDMSPILDNIPKEVSAIVDASVNPNTWNALEQNGRNVFWFLPATTQVFGLAYHLHEKPLYGGPSAICSAVALCAELQASEIVLVGCTRAFSKDGRAYCKGNKWQAVHLDKIEKIDGRWVASISGREEQSKLHLASGQRAALEKEIVVPIKMSDGSLRFALETTKTSSEWLEEFACYNQQIKLTQIGWEEDVALDGWGAKPIKKENINYATAQDIISFQATKAKEVSEAVVSGDRLDLTCEGFDIVEYFSSPEMLQLKESGITDPKSIIPLISKLQGNCADEVLFILEQNSVNLK